jgi:hypothetical protein
MEDTMFKAYHYIVIRQRTENILILELNEENEKIREQIEKDYYTNKLEIYNISTLEAPYDKMPKSIVTMIDDMKKEGKTRLNYQIDTFEDNTKMDIYIKETAEQLQKWAKEFNENNKVDEVETN